MSVRTALRLTVACIIAMVCSVVGLGSVTAAHAADAPHLSRGERSLAVALSSQRDCVADVALFEDGSWMGLGLTVDGVRIAEHWDVTGPESRGLQPSGVYGMGWPLALTDGTPCSVSDLGTAELRTACTASVRLFEDGSWMGTRLEVDRERVSRAWTVSGPELQGTVTADGVAHLDFPATWHGVQCAIVVSA